MTPLEKTILLISLIPLFIAMAAFAIHLINHHHHERKAKRTNTAINKLK